MRWLLILVILCAPAYAVEPDEILADPVLEARARDISQGLRCLVCQNESIDESEASLARDLRLLVRERLVAGDSNDDAVSFIVARYGEFVLLQPTLSGSNLILWGAGPGMALIAFAFAGLYLRRRARATDHSHGALSDEEKAQLDKILRS